jgi:hypothetical protein
MVWKLAELLDALFLSNGGSEVIALPNMVLFGSGRMYSTTI